MIAGNIGCTYCTGTSGGHDAACPCNPNNIGYEPRSEVERLNATISALREENERLRSTLRRIADEEQLAHSQEDPHELARAALDEKR